MRTIISLSLLAVVTFIHCQEQEQMIVFTLQEVLEKLEGINDKLEDMQQKQENLETKIHGLSQETGQCLRGDDLEHLTNVSAAAHQEIKSFIHEEISGVISLAQKDDCSEGSHPCGRLGVFTCSCPSGFSWDGSECADIDECIQGKEDCSVNAKCTNTLGSYSCSCNPPFEGNGRICSCPPGFASKGDICEDIDECAECKGFCHPNATCKNSIGSYSCSCNKPFEGDGISSGECRSPSKDFGGLGCVKLVEERKTFQEMIDFCREEGGRLLQHSNQHQLDDVGYTFGIGIGWVGMFEGKWTSDESFVPDDLLLKGYRSDPWRPCGILIWDSSSTSYKVTHGNCSTKSYGLCQFQLP